MNKRKILWVVPFLFLLLVVPLAQVLSDGPSDPLLIQKTTVTGSAVQTMSLTGINLTPGRAYTLRVAILSPTANEVNYYLWINQDTTGEHYYAVAFYRQYGEDPGVIDTESRNDGRINDNNRVAQFMFHSFELVIAPSGKVYLIGHYSTYELGYHENADMSEYYTQAVSSVTRIDIWADVSGGIDIGSWAALYRTEADAEQTTTTTSQTTTSQTTTTATSQTVTTDTIGSTANHEAFGADGYLLACKVTASANGTLSLIGINIYGAAGHLRLAVYSDNGQGTHPSALLAESGSVTAVNGWNDLTPGSTPQIVQGTVYWIVLQYDNGGLNLYYASLTNGLRYNAQAYGAFPSSWPGGDAGSNEQLNMRITYAG